MDDSEHHDRGMNVRRKVLGHAWVDKANAGRTAFNAEQQAVYCGVPAANHAFKEAGDILDEVAKANAGTKTG
jgi:hypothetical protein